MVCGRYLCRKYTTHPRTVVGLHETITASEQVMKCNNIHGCFSIFLLNFKPEEGKINQHTMGIEDESFATLMGSVSTEIRINNFEKQKNSKRRA